MKPLTKWIALMLILAATATAAEIDISGMKASEPQICTPDMVMCAVGSVGQSTARLAARTYSTLKTTAPDEPMILVFNTPVSLVGWDSVPVNYGDGICRPKTIIFCGINLYNGYPICQMESHAPCWRWNNSTPFNNEWLIFSVYFYNLEIWDLYYCTGDVGVCE